MFSNLPTHPFLLHRHQSAHLIPLLLTLSLPVYLPKPTAPSSHSARGLSCTAYGTLSLSPGSSTPASPTGYLPASWHSAASSFTRIFFHLKRKLPGFYILPDYLISFFLHSQVFERVIHTNFSFSHLPLMNWPTMTWFLPPSHRHSDWNHRMLNPVDVTCTSLSWL